MRIFSVWSVVGCGALAFFLGCAKTEPAPVQPSEPEPATQPQPGAPRGKSAPCILGQDQTCNDDPKVSALWGHCTELGVCECHPGFERSPRTSRCQPVR